jgi:hypothetical protein
MIFILSKVPPRLSYDQPDPHGVDVESELQHTLLKALATPCLFLHATYEMV